jgi:hypothetical protein
MAQQQFGEWVEQLSRAMDVIVFKLLNGDTVTVRGPFHFGEGFVAGSASRGTTPDHIAVRYDAVATVRGENFDVTSSFSRPLDHPPGSAI